MKRNFNQPNFAHSASLRVRVVKIYPYFVFCLFASFLAACAQATPATPGAGYRAETVVLPTGAPTSKPTPVSTRVIPADSLTPGPAPTQTPLPDQVRALVVSALDGDTINVVMEGDPPGQTYKVRYLGIDAPPNTPSVPWGIVAFEMNEKLTKGKVVRLERDQSDMDSEGNLLRYVYLGDELLSITLAEQGLARAAVNEPDTRFRAEISDAEQRARAGKLGLWGNRPPTPRPVTSPTTAITATTTLTVTTVPLATTAPETPSTAEPAATTGVTPAATVSPTTEPEATVTAEPSGETSTTTPEPTGEPTPASDSTGDGLQGPQ